MGIFGHRFFFKEELPKVSEVKKKFFEITGLQLGYYSVAQIDELVSEAEDILYSIRKRRDETNYIVLNSPRFECDGFDDLYLGDYMQPETRSFYINGGIRTKNMYFFRALIKTMHELDGYTFKYSTYPHDEDLDVEKYLKPYHPYEREWKNIKKWNEMSEMEKARFKGFYNDGE